MPLTAHFIGGCAIGDSTETGVIDGYQRVFGHPGLHVADGSAVTANLGREPVADDHRPGRAGDGVLAQQGRAPTRGRPWASSTHGSSRSPHRLPGRTRVRAPAPCVSRSSASAELPFYRRNPPAGCSLSGRNRSSTLPPSDRSPGPGAVQRMRGRSRARPPSLPGRALVHLRGPPRGIRPGPPGSRPSWRRPRWRSTPRGWSPCRTGRRSVGGRSTRRRGCP